jgi:hypothetical protein
MKKNKYPLRTGYKQRSQEHLWLTDNRKSRLLTTGKVLVFLVGIPGLYVGILSVLPRISITPQEPLQRHEPFSAPFIISNDGYSTVHTINLTCSLDSVLDTHRNRYTNVTTPSSQNIDYLAAGGRSTFDCPVGNLQILEADFSIIVSFRPDFLPWHKIEIFHFRARIADNGSVRWFPQ